MKPKKQVIGGDLIIGGRKLSLSKAIRAGDFVYLTGQVPFKDGEIMISGTIEEQTITCIEQIREILAEAGCDLTSVVKAMIWLRDKEDFSGFNEVYGQYFPEEPPARSAIISQMLVDVRVEIEVVAYDPQ